MQYHCHCIQRACHYVIWTPALVVAGLSCHFPLLIKNHATRSDHRQANEMLLSASVVLCFANHPRFNLANLPQYSAIPATFLKSSMFCLLRNSVCNGALHTWGAAGLDLCYTAAAAAHIYTVSQQPSFCQLPLLTTFEQHQSTTTTAGAAAAAAAAAAAVQQQQCPVHLQACPTAATAWMQHNKTKFTGNNALVRHNTLKITCLQQQQQPFLQLWRQPGECQ